MVKIGKPTSQRFLTALIYGPPGQGKTTLLGSAIDDERTNPMLLLDFEGGTDSLVGRDIDVVHVRDWTDFNESFAILEDRKCKYRSVAIDSLTETQQFCLFSILEKEKANRRDPDALQQQDYGKMFIQMKRLMREFRDLPMHVFVTATVKQDIDPREGMVKRPNFSGAFAEEIMALMSVVAYLAITQTPDKQTRRQLVINNNPKVLVKARLPWEAKIPDMLENASITGLLDALQYPYPSGTSGRVPELALAGPD